MKPNKISPRRSSLQLSPFNQEQVSWIILKFGELKCISAVKRAFGTKFYRGYPRKVPKLLAFKRPIDRFSNSGHTRSLAPPGSPDMNPLDFFLWGHTMSHIFRCQPRTLTDMKDMVDDFCRSLDADLIKKVCRSVHSRAKLCLEQEEGHFEHIKNVAKRGLEY